MTVPSFKDFPIWVIFGLQVIFTVITAVIGYLTFKPDSGDEIDAFMFGIAAAGISIMGSLFVAIRDHENAKDALQSEQNRVREYHDLVDRAMHTINIVDGGEGIPKIRISVVQSFDEDRYPIQIWCENHDQYPIHDLQITIEDPELLPPPFAPDGSLRRWAEDIALRDQYKKGAQEKIGPYTMPANRAEVIYKTSLRIESKRGGGYSISVRWRKGHYLLIIPNCYVEEYLPVFDPPKIFIGADRIPRREMANYYTFTSYIENSIEHSRSMERRFLDWKARFNVVD